MSRGTPAPLSAVDVAAAAAYAIAAALHRLRSPPDDMPAASAPRSDLTGHHLLRHNRGADAGDRAPVGTDPSTAADQWSQVRHVPAAGESTPPAMEPRTMQALARAAQTLFHARCAVSRSASQLLRDFGGEAGPEAIKLLAMADQLIRMESAVSKLDEEATQRSLAQSEKSLRRTRRSRIEETLSDVGGNHAETPAT